MYGTNIAKMRFSGNIRAKLDSKGRVFMPAVFRRVLLSNNQGCMYLRKDVFQDCIVVYAESVWEDLLKQMRLKLNRWIPEEQEVFRQFMIEAEMVTLDSSGRLLLSKRLLSSANIEDKVSFLGVDDTIEIWSQKGLDDHKIDPDVFKNKISEIMGSK